MMNENTKEELDDEQLTAVSGGSNDDGQFGSFCYHCNECQWDSTIWSGCISNPSDDAEYDLFSHKHFTNHTNIQTISKLPEYIDIIP